ncbi:MAG: phenylalanine--tRNA ligase subunit beta [Fibrobacteria bacterium]|nr:phenylalanine--tRNA ligase subunit beta [Fibrobacteria bacterium]
MLISLNWLKQYVNINVSVDELANTLTFLGIEVEEIEQQGADITGVVAAQTLSCEAHPDADKLSICKVNDGENEYQVVCGAPNVKSGQTVLFAKTGAKLTGGFKIKKSKIRGVPSEGMICAEDELGLGGSHEGIMTLSSDITPGTPMQEIPGLCDTRMELNITPNRPDALSYIGVAREVAAFYDQELKMPDLRPPKLDAKQTNKDTITLNIESPEDCSLYTGVIINKVKVGPSPTWLVEALQSIGQKSINNVVDITNFVLLESGQPSHAFDLKKITGNTLFVRRAKKGESVLTLDEEIKNLDERDLVIADNAGPACLAGVIGGETTKVDEKTTSLFLEVAYFSPPVVRQQARRHGISTDASYRFERGIDPLHVEAISNYLCRLITDITGGNWTGETLIAKAPEHPISKKLVQLRLSRLSKILGITIDRSQVVAMLEKIDIKEEAGNDLDTLSFTIPGFRPDIEREIDLIEEVARLYNFNNIPDQLPTFELSPTALPEAERLASQIRHHLASQGLFEALSLRFSSHKYLNNLNLPEDSQLFKTVNLKNPLNEEWEIMPSLLMPGLLNAIHRNKNNRELDCRFFEIGKCFYNNKEDRTDKNPGIIEEEKLIIGLSGSWHSVSWNEKGGVVDFYVLKGILENLFKTIGYPRSSKVDFSIASQPFLHPKESMSVLVNNKPIGWFGSVHPNVLSNFGLKDNCYIAEISITGLLEHASSTPVFKPFSNFTSVTREMNIVVGEGVTHETLLSWMPLSKAKNLEEVKLNSIYRGKGLEDNTKALHYSFVYRHPERTLTDKEVNKIQERIAQELTNRPEVSFK